MMDLGRSQSRPASDYGLAMVGTDETPEFAEVAVEASDCMSELILHHFDISPYAEKIRVLMGLKGLAWRSVEIPRILPKPDVIALTGGYRRTPILQLGADIYCDTALIATTIDKLAPQTPLWPRGLEAAAYAMARYADSVVFDAASVLFGASTAALFDKPHLVMQVFKCTPDEMRVLMADRVAMREGAAPRPSVADAQATLRTFLDFLEKQLSDGRGRILGIETSMADCSVYHPLWHVGRMPGADDALAPYRHVRRWMSEVAAAGHGTPTPMTSQQAIKLAMASTPESLEPVSDSPAFAPGSLVEVLPTDYAFNPVRGSLIQLTAEHVVVARTDARAGDVHVHLPRQGYQVRAAAK